MIVVKFVKMKWKHRIDREEHGEARWNTKFQKKKKKKKKKKENTDLSKLDLI